MRATALCIPVFFAAVITARPVGADDGNPQIDFQKFAANVASVGELRESRRISESEFLQLAADPSTIVLDARSKEKYDLLHIRGAKHLSLPDITADELERLIPTKSTRVLIYCNNNFENEPRAFPAKAAAASLNLHTFTVLHSYGYTNVYELKPLLDVNRTKIPFSGTQAATKHVILKSLRHGIKKSSAPPRGKISLKGKSK